jgi:hypothetical protein
MRPMRDVRAGSSARPRARSAHSLTILRLGIALALGALAVGVVAIAAAVVAR